MLVDFRARGDAQLPTGCDPDRALLLDTGAVVVSGAEALRMLAATASASGLDRLLFGNPAVGRRLYPLLRALRGAYLRTVGRHRVRAKGRNS